MALFFDDNDSGYGRESIDPLWTIDIEDNEAVLKWGQRAFDSLVETSQDRHFMIRTILSALAGKYYAREPRKGDKSRLIGETKARPEFPRVVTSHLRSLLEQKVAMQLKYKPDTEAIPYNQEFTDKIDAISANKFLKHVKEQNKIPLLYPRFARRAIATGQSFIYPYWNKYVGPIKKKKIERKIPLKRDDLSIAFRTVDIPERSGDISVAFPKTEDVFLFPAENMYDMPAVMIRSYVDVWQLRSEYPELADEIKPTGNISSFDYLTCEEGLLQNQVLVLEFYYKSSNILEKGLYFKMCPTCILEEVQDNPISPEGKENFELGNIPLIRLVDDEHDFDINGYSSLIHLYGQQQLYDNITTQFAMNIAMYCHPKWVFPKNTCNIQQLANIPGLFVEFLGNVPPKLEVSGALTQDQFAFRDSVLSNMEKTSGVFSVSRGAPPPGTRATSQLYFYDEQEQQLNAPFKRKFDSCVEQLDMTLLSLMAENYSGDKERLVWILGKENQWVAESLDVKALDKPYTIRIKAGSNLPDNKSARLNALFELYQMNPNAVTWDQLMEMLDFGQQEKYVDYARISIISAEAENEDMMSGKDVKSPERYEIHVDHLKVHYKMVQAPQFKDQTKKIQQAIMDHIGAHEMLAMDIAGNNQLYAQTLQTLNQFPVIADYPIPDPNKQVMPPEQAQAMQEAAMQQGQQQQQQPKPQDVAKLAASMTPGIGESNNPEQSLLPTGKQASAKPQPLNITVNVKDGRGKTLITLEDDPENPGTRRGLVQPIGGQDE